ncbi:MAG: phosphoenolpyruvate--protein phosphotransferase [Fibrobacter sp.]|nr:phosphoenolpyruvate--protein phosphotransferase [Fibrobacter sp.]
MSETTLIIQGNPISPGLAEGKIHVHRTLLGPIDAAPQGDGRHSVKEELGNLDIATSKITDDLLSLAMHVEKEIDTRLSKVFEVHQLILHDASLRKELRQEIVDNLVSAGSAVKTVFLRWEKRFMMMESQIARSKSEDLRDIEIRLRNALAGITIHPLEQIPYGCILATTRLLPSDTVFLVGRSTAAVLLEYGSTGSHAALFARELGLPCISGIANLQATIPDGAFCLVDADTGVATIGPDEEQITVFRKKVDLKNRVIKESRADALVPAVTKNGIRINVQANVGGEEDTSIAIANGAEGVGLYRMERTYLGSTVPPSTGELLNEMRQTLRPAIGHGVCVRLLDIGADKPMPYMEFMAETNPSLGRRGIRLLREYPQLLKTHLQAVLELSREFNVSVLVPMVTIPDDVVMVKNYLRQLASQLSISSLPKLGAMIETPAAALSAREIAKHVDFLSFGTNDLTQYAFAADRENAAVEMYFNDSSDVIFRMLRIVHDDVPGMPLSICGELGGRPEYIARLLQCGIRTFSVAPPLVPIIKETIRKAIC